MTFDEVGGKTFINLGCGLIERDESMFDFAQLILKPVIDLTILTRVPVVNELHHG